MGNIIILDENTANKIAAGEVVERPASVIKELVENSIDAGAGSITVEIKNGGISYMKVADNGGGIAEDDVEIAFERHATSKIRNADDLDTVSSMGFRGEALASIAAVSSIRLSTRVPGRSQGISIEVTGGRVQEVKPTGCPVGTSITVRDLFFNTPARFKFLKKDTTEAGYVSDIISRIALGNPHISFRLTSNGTGVLHTPGNGDQLSAIFSIYGRETAKAVNTVEYDDGRLRITGFAGKPEIARSNRSFQSIYINRRFIKSKTVGSAIDEAYTTFLMKNKYAFVVLNIDLNPVLVDVNVHPSKMEVKFSNEQDIFKAVYNALSNSLHEKTAIRTVQPEVKDRSPFKLNTERPPVKTEYEQLDFGSAAGKTVFPEPLIKETEPDEYDIPEKRNEPEPQALSVPAVEHAPAGSPSRQDKLLLREARLIGQVFSTYILLQQENDLILVDQHAAHERIMYEELKARYERNEPMSQFLLSPVPVELTYQESEYLKEHSPFFDRLGFKFEGFGANSVILRAVPTGRETDNVRELFLEVLDFLMKNGRSKNNMPADETLYMMACKAAVKANSALEESEAATLLERLSEVENPFTCPHGRPSVIKLRKYDLEKMFKRIV
jgi:DNA mismatch repair protein MutL